MMMMASIFVPTQSELLSFHSEIFFFDSVIRWTGVKMALKKLFHIWDRKRIIVNIIVYSIQLEYRIRVSGFVNQLMTNKDQNVKLYDITGIDSISRSYVMTINDVGEFFG